EEHLQDISRLKRAVEIYRGDLFAEEPFAEWVFEERGRMKSLAQRALRRLVEHHRTEGDLAAAARYMEREADLQPFDTEVQRALVRLLLEQGRRSEAKRRYAFFRQRLLDEFGEEPDFRLSDFANGRGRDGGGD
ncbi:MAG: AfsR/SARP family transcriptional regulator, partial [Solirubrobacterales bacterium]